MSGRKWPKRIPVVGVDSGSARVWHADFPGSVTGSYIEVGQMMLRSVTVRDAGRVVARFKEGSPARRRRSKASKGNA